MTGYVHEVNLHDILFYIKNSTLQTLFDDQLPPSRGKNANYHNFFIFFSKMLVAFSTRELIALQKFGENTTAGLVPS
jgi:hypothetical protein